MTISQKVSELADAIISELDDRSCFNGIDEDIMEEIREEVTKIIELHLDD
jgi:hypothetical protein